MDSLLLNIIQLLNTMQRLGTGQIQGLCYFVANGKTHINVNPLMMEGFIKSLSHEEVTEYIQLSPSWLPIGADTLSGSIIDTDKKEKALSFLMIYQIYLLKELFMTVPWDTLVKIIEFLNAGNQGLGYQYDLQVMQEIQQLMVQMQADVMLTLKEELNNATTDPVSLLTNLIELDREHFHLYSPLATILLMSQEEMLHFHQVFPTLEPIQLMFITRLKEVGLGNAADLFFLFSGEQDNMQPYGIEEPPDPPIKLQIVEQPPDKCVYRRNVRPNPAVAIQGNLSENDGNLYVVPVLVRCDTFEDIPEQVVGNEREKITSNRAVIFKKLKILSTSHQLNETHFSLRFELRHYPVDDNLDQYKVLHSVTSDPICVYSHSTQLKPSAKTKPTLIEIVPPYGSSIGSTRVAILGNNFVDSPATRVRFDGIEVMPIFHGPRTLICNTPKHHPGPVHVQVCNEPNQWSQPQTFIYEQYQQEQPVMNFMQPSTTSYV